MPASSPVTGPRPSTTRSRQTWSSVRARGRHRGRPRIDRGLRRVAAVPSRPRTDPGAHTRPGRDPGPPWFHAEDAVNELLDAGSPGRASGPTSSTARCPRARSSAPTPRPAPRSSPARRSPTSCRVDRMPRRPPSRPRPRSSCPSFAGSPRTMPSTSCSSRASGPASAPRRSTTRSPVDLVVGTDPGAGTEVDPGQRRRLRRVPGRRADPEAPVTVPDLRGVAMPMTRSTRSSRPACEPGERRSGSTTTCPRARSCGPSPRRAPRSRRHHRRLPCLPRPGADPEPTEEPTPNRSRLVAVPNLRGSES